MWPTLPSPTRSLPPPPSLAEWLRSRRTDQCDQGPIRSAGGMRFALSAGIHQQLCRSPTPATPPPTAHSNTIQHVRAETEASIPAGLKTLSGKNFSTLNKHEAVKQIKLFIYSNNYGHKSFITYIFVFVLIYLFREGLQSVWSFYLLFSHFYIFYVGASWDYKFIYCNLNFMYYLRIIAYLC